MRKAGREVRLEYVVSLTTTPQPDAVPETWLFSFEPRMLAKLYATVGQYAADPDLSFDWADARDVIDRAQRLVRAHAS